MVEMGMGCCIVQDPLSTTTIADKVSGAVGGSSGQEGSKRRPLDQPISREAATTAAGPTMLRELHSPTPPRKPCEPAGPRTAIHIVPFLSVGQGTKECVLWNTCLPPHCLLSALSEGRSRQRAIVLNGINNS